MEKDSRFEKDLSQLIKDGEINWFVEKDKHVQSIRQGEDRYNCASDYEDVYSEMKKNSHNISSALEHSLKDIGKNSQKVKEYLIIAEELAQKVGLKIPEKIIEGINELNDLEEESNLKNNKDLKLEKGIEISIRGRSEMNSLGLTKCAERYLSITRFYLFKKNSKSWWKFKDDPTAYLNQNVT
jgi:hypothetical protein